MTLVELINDSPNRDYIDFLLKQKHRVIGFGQVFCKGDADTLIEDTAKPLTDKDWKKVVEADKGDEPDLEGFFNFIVETCDVGLVHIE